MPGKQYPVLLPDLQVGFHFKLKNLKDLYFHEALSKTVSSMNIADIDHELQEMVSAEALQKLAGFLLRGETVFPVPVVLKANPFLLGYYRLLLGFSQKEFYSKGPFGAFRSMEEKGAMSRTAAEGLTEMCKSLIASAEVFAKGVDTLSIAAIEELQLLTVGPQFRGSMNNTYGAAATEKTFGIIKELCKAYIQQSTPTAIQIKNDSGRRVNIAFAADPDIEISEELPSAKRGLISIEIKGGRDISNIHNRIGEAEKSHQKAKKRGYFEFMTIISVDIDYTVLQAESPTTSHFFHIDKISDIKGSEFQKFRELICSILGIS